MATASTTPHRPVTSPEVMSTFLRTTLPLILTFCLGATLIGAIVYLILVFVQRRGTESEFVFRRLEESLSVRGAEIDPRWWLLVLIPLLTLGFVYAGWQYVRDGRAVGPAWAAFMALLRCTVYGVLAFAFLLPATQAWEISRNQSKILIAIDVTPSVVFLRDDVPTEKVPFNKLPTRQDKVLEFLADSRVDFLGRLQAKNPVTAYRWGRLLDEEFHVFDRSTDGPGMHYTREEWAAKERDPEGWKNKEPAKMTWTAEDWTAWLKPRFEAPAADVQGDDRNKLLKIIDDNQHMFATTNLGDPLLSMMNREASNLLQGVIVISDGRSTEGGPAAIKELTERAKKNKIPIFVIAVGEDRPRVQLEFTDLRLPKMVRPDDEFQIYAELNGQGMAGDEVEVKLVAYKPSNPKEEFEIATQKVRFSVGQMPHAQAEFKITPNEKLAGTGADDAQPTKPGESAKPEYEVGEWKFVARVAKDKREVFPDPEHRTDPALLQVQRKPLSVLLVASAPSREYQFVRTFFVREMEKGRADVCIYLQPPPGRDEARQGVVNDVPGERLLKNFPTRFEDPGKGDGADQFDNLGRYDVVIAFDPDWNRVSGDQMKMIQRWVDLGHGLIVVAGPIHTLDLARPSDEADPVKPMLDLYPVELADIRIQNLDRNTTEPWRLNFQGVTPEMEFMRLDEKQDAMNPLKGWEDFFHGVEGAGGPKGQPALRGFYNYYPVKSPKAGTQVIATFADPLAKMNDGREQPFLAVMPYGTGKVFWIGSGEIWRLRGYKESYHDRFWAKLTRYVGSGSLTQLNRRITPIIGRSFQANSFINFDVKVLGKDMKPLDERAKPKLVLTPPRGALEKDISYDMAKKLSTAEGWTGTFTSRFLVRTPGEYQYKIEVAETGDSETGKFVVKESNPELDNSRPDFEQLWELASEADDFLVRIKDDLIRRKVKEMLTRPRPVSTEDRGEKKPDAKTDDRPHFLFDLMNAEVIPDCVSYDYREQRSRGAAEDWWDGGYPWDEPKEKRWFSWVLAVIVGLLSMEWLARKLLRLA